jgi:hypothetical protein
MRYNMLNENDFQRFKEMLESDAKLKEIVDLATAEAVHSKRDQWLIPYVNAPGLKGKPWKKSARR